MLAQVLWFIRPEDVQRLVETAIEIAIEDANTTRPSGEA